MLKLLSINPYFRVVHILSTSLLSEFIICGGIPEQFCVVFHGPYILCVCLGGLCWIVKPGGVFSHCFSKRFSTRFPVFVIVSNAMNVEDIY